MTRDRFAGAVLFLFSLGVIWESRALPLGDLHTPGPGYMPVVLAAVLAGLSVLIVLGGGAAAPLASLPWTEGRHALAILGGCAFSALALERLGYRLTVIILLVFLLGLMERRRLVVTAALALGLALGSFFLFSNLLKLPLPRGPFGL